MKSYFLILFFAFNCFSSINFVDIAREEINLSKRVNKALPKSSATVEVKLHEPPRKPREATVFAGILTSPYHPSGRRNIDNFESFDYGKLDYSPLFRIKVAYLHTLIKSAKIGLFLNFSYARHNVELVTRTGLEARDTNLHSFFTSSGLSFENKFFSKKVFSGFDLGYSNTKFIQSSDIRTGTFNENVAGYVVSPSIRWKFISKVSLLFSYEYLKPVKKNLIPQKHSFFLGLLGELN